ncbi:TetR/AcrR family transcriptional regulator [Amycolatopsis sp.]|uniref:TetR/AcrR family transcriptional regulator n=1 Tax=Amycolatopsis sp. TaxID=37632 RepID=UPI002C206713|nr:TetR/AcrR family transcriptional regulator [Amycolatopsis sp.]HVV08149.1 TetR/AcrR family transcriptional regulator [Amycolatopsis sp.]
MTARPEPRGDSELGARAARTRAAILEASKQLFLERGYDGTRITNITDACGISRAGFYTYFKDKREIFNALGETTYREVLEVTGEWDDLPRPCTRDDVLAWVRRYFAFLDRHGAFILSAQTAPAEEDVRAASSRMQMRVCWQLGVSLRSRQEHPVDAPEALGLAVQAMLDRAWYRCKVERLGLDHEDVLTTVATMIVSTLRA